MPRHPSEYFVRYLMTSPLPNAEPENDVWVITTVSQLGFPRPTPEYIQILRATVYEHMPALFQPQNKYHRDSSRFLRDQGIYSMHHPDKAVREANTLVTNFRARPVVENLLLGRMEPKDVAKRVNARLGEFYTAEGIECYRHYYWNTHILRIEDWQEIFQQYEGFRDQAMAILQSGPAMALHKLGFEQSLDSKQVLKEMLETIYFDHKDWKSAGRSNNKTKAITELAKAAVALDARLQESNSAVSDTLKSFESFRMQHAKKAVPSIRDLAPAGNFTGSGAKLIDSGGDDESQDIQRVGTRVTAEEE